MGREVRKVPENWQHPKNEKGNFIPLYGEDYDTKAKEWMNNAIAWDNGTHPDLVEHPERKQDFTFWWEYDGMPPDPDNYVHYDSKPTWYQMYETVDEGTPVSPPFATQDELVEYLVANGDFWDQSIGHGGWNRENAKRFVAAGWSLSGIVENGVFKAPRDM